MEYRLMHKNTAVANITLDDASCFISRVGEVHAENHVPVGIPVRKGEIDRAALNEWWKSRAIPASRQGIREALDELHLSTTQRLLDKCFGLSLSDQYWICPADSRLTWQSVNFFENAFSDDVGDILFGHGSSGEEISLMSPDNTSDGWLRKKWAILEGRRCLIKGGSAPAYQEPYNEVLASAVMRRLNIPHVPYTLLMQDESPYSVCEDFITPQTELISAWYVMQTRKKENHVSVYQHYLNCCEGLGIPGITDALDRMMVLDYLIVNEDRHQNNFGVVRNAETLEWLGAAPIFDSGTSLWFNQFTDRIRPAAPKQPCKPFKTTHDEQIKLVTSFDWLDFAALDGIDEELRTILQGSPVIDAARCDALCMALCQRVELLRQVREASVKRVFAPDWSAEIQTDIAYSGREPEGEDLER